MYDWVHIYEFEGNVSHKISSLIDEDYIGFWKEAGYSFLFFKKEKKPHSRGFPSLIVRNWLFVMKTGSPDNPLTCLELGKLLSILPGKHPHLTMGFMSASTQPWPSAPVTMPRPKVA